MAVWFVDVSGSHNSGTGGLDSNNGNSWSTAKATVTQAIMSSSAGDYVHIGYGLYNHNSASNNKDDILIVGLNAIPSLTQSTTVTVYERYNEFGTMIVSGNTSFGTFDTDTTFTADASKTSGWIVRTLGYPVLDVELTDPMLYDCYERATFKYSEMINNAEAVNYLSSFIGKSFTTSSNWTGQLPVITGNWLRRFVQPASAMIGRGTGIQMKTGSLTLAADTQWADLTNFSNTYAGGEHVQIHDVFWGYDPAVNRAFNPASYMNLIDSETLPAYAGGSVNVTYIAPIFDTALRVHSVKLSDEVRRGKYFHIVMGNKIWFTPPPSTETTVWFTYTTPRDPLSAEFAGQTTGSTVVTSIYNVPFGVVTYGNINSAGKQWIREYSLACAKEMLANVRGKYDSIPIPGNDALSMNADRLAAEADSEKDKLVDRLKELLDLTSLKTILASESEMGDNAQKSMQKMPSPLPIFKA